MAQTRVHELAKEFGIESKLVLEKFKEMGEFVKSASSRVPLPVEMRFRKMYGEELKGNRQPRGPARPTRALGLANVVADDRPPRRPQQRARQSKPAPSKHLIDASRIFGVPVDELKPAQMKRPRGRYASSESRRPVTAWEENWIDDEERRAWIAAGLDPDDGRRAGQLKDKGITPEDLDLHVDGVRANARLRGGESVSSVAAGLREVKSRRNRDAG